MTERSAETAADTAGEKASAATAEATAADAPTGLDAPDTAAVRSHPADANKADATPADANQTDARPGGATRTGATKQTPLLIEQLGGWRGLFDSTFPVVVFVVANTLGGLTVAIWAAVGAGVGVSLLRLARKQSVQQSVSGLFGVAIAAYIAHRTGTAKGYFLFGIWASFAYATLFFGSVLVRWPLVGVIWEYVEGGAGTWRRNRRLMQVYCLLTLMWAGIFLARGLVQHFLYDADQTGWLAFARISMGYPVTLGALGLTLLLVRRVRRSPPAG